LLPPNDGDKGGNGESSEALADLEPGPLPPHDIAPERAERCLPNKNQGSNGVSPPSLLPTSPGTRA
jgi:hypothetical protein